MKRQVQVFTLILFILFTASVRAAEVIEPLYLSFEQRVLASYALLAAGETPEVKQEIIKRAQQMIDGYRAKPVQEVRVQNFEDFLQKWRGEWPNTHSLALDLELIEKNGPRGLSQFVSSSPRIQKKIDAYIASQPQRLAAQQEFQTTIKNIQGLLLENKIDKISSDVGYWKNLALSESENLVEKQMSELDHVGKYIADSPMLAGKDRHMQVLLQVLFSEYYSRLSPASKKLIVSSFLGDDLRADELKKFSIMVQNSGPQLQKMLQVVARQADLSPEMLDVFRKLEDSVREVPFSQVSEILESEKENYRFDSIERKPLGVGTMAQVHRAKILDKSGKKQSVVVRFLKPGIYDRVEEDHRILTEVAKILDENKEFRSGAPKISPLINEITNTVRAEFDLKATLDRQVMASKSYEHKVLIHTGDIKNDLHFRVPKLYLSKQKSELMVQELIIGRKIDKEVKDYESLAPDLKKVIIEQLARLWVNEAIFGNGFYHADLHHGNFLVQVTDPEIRVNILDFGMGGQLSEDLRRELILLGAGIDLKRADLMASAYWNIANKKNMTLKKMQLQSYIQEKLNDIAKGKAEPLTIEGWTAFVSDLGLVLPYDFINMNRGIVIVNKLLKDAGLHYTVTTLSREIGRSHPHMIYKALVARGEVSMSDFMRLGMRELARMFFTESKSATSLNISKEKSAAAGLRCEAVWH